MKIENETLVENLLGWSDIDRSFRREGFQWAAEIDAEESNDDRTVVHVWGVELSTGLRRVDGWVETTRCHGEKTVTVRAMKSGDWDDVEVAFLSPEAEA